MPITIQSTSFSNGGFIPPNYTLDADNRSPLLRWGAIPTGTKSMAIICEDPDAPMGVFVHWVIYNIPTNLREIAENQPKMPQLRDLGTQGYNSFRKIGYDGPYPPPGKLHTYQYKVYALKLEPTLPPGLTAAQLREKMTDQIVEEAQYVGRYQR